MKFCHSIEDAKEKVCPVSMSNPENSVTCEAYHCMAWRWVETHIKNPTNPDGDLVKSTTSHGFCGMAVDPRQ